MICIPEMLAACAEKAGITLPKDIRNYDADKFPHWYVYKLMQSGAPMPYASAHWDNAKVIAAIPNDRIMKVTYDEVIEMGFAVGYSKP